MYVLNDIVESYEVVEEVIKFAGDLTKYLNNDIAKYKTLLGIKIKVGASFGSFYNLEFKRENADEETVKIGFLECLE